MKKFDKGMRVESIAEISFSVSERDRASDLRTLRNSWFPHVLVSVGWLIRTDACTYHFQDVILPSLSASSVRSSLAQIHFIV